MAGDVSQLLVRWSGGDDAALAELTPIVYSELRKLGQSYLAQRRNEALLQPTVLVHEAWIKLANTKQLNFTNRSQFYGLAAKIMRGILVDHFRRQTATKRGGTQVLVPLEEGAVSGAGPHFPDLLALDDALNRLAKIKPRYTQIVELKFFGGLTIEESAAALQISQATVEREWNFSRFWLRRELTLNLKPE